MPSAWYCRKAYGIPPYPPFRQGGLFAAIQLPLRGEALSSHSLYTLCLHRGSAGASPRPTVRGCLCARRGGYQPPANVAFGTMSDNGALANFTSSVSAFDRSSFPCEGKPCPHTVCKPCAFTGFRREQAPALRYEVGLCARRGGYQPPANVAFGTMSPGKANGMIRWYPRRADDICPYGA